MVGQVHSAGMRLMMDLVINHIAFSPLVRAERRYAGPSLRE